MNYSIIVASGSGQRMESTIRKQYILLKGKPILYHTLKRFVYHPSIDKIILVLPKEDKAFVIQSILCHFPKREKTIEVVEGGRRRQDSVFNGLGAIPNRMGVVLIHDGVRPFILPDHITHALTTAKDFGGCILGTPATDTLKKIEAGGIIHQTLDRNEIWMAQTPQAFKIDIIKKAYTVAMEKHIEATDDASLVEYLGIPVKFINGSRFNIKITTPEDLIFANAILAHQSDHP